MESDVLWYHLGIHTDQAAAPERHVSDSSASAHNDAALSSLDLRCDVLVRQVITNGVQTFNQGVTYIEDGSIGMKYTYTPNPNAKDHGMPDVLCKSEAMSEAELARYDSYDPVTAGPTMFAGNVFLTDRVTTAFIDPSVQAPGISVLFLDPFKNVPAGM